MTTATISKQDSNVLLAAWLAENYPALFAQLVAKVAPAQPAQPLQGFSDVLRSIGSGITSAASAITSTLSSGVKAVGSFLGSQQGQETLTGLAAAYGALNAATISTQQQRASAGQAPAVIETRYDPSTQSYVPIYAPTGTTGYAVTGEVLNTLQPSFLKKYGMVLAIGGVALVGIYFLFRK